MSVAGDTERERAVFEVVERVLAQDHTRSDDMNAVKSLKQAGVGIVAGLTLLASTLGIALGGGGGVAVYAAENGAGNVVEPTSSVTVRDLQRYDGFEDYAAQGQQMENSDVGCFANECKRETASCFTDGSCLKVIHAACWYKIFIRSCSMFAEEPVYRILMFQHSQYMILLVDDRDPHQPRVEDEIQRPQLQCVHEWQW